MGKSPPPFKGFTYLDVGKYRTDSEKVKGTFEVPFTWSGALREDSGARHLGSASHLAFLRRASYRRGQSCYNLPMDLKIGENLPGGPLSPLKIGAILLPFMLLLMMSGANTADFFQRARIFEGLGAVLLGLLVLVWIIGVVRGLPLWSLPALGLVLFFLGFFFLHWIAQAAVSGVLAAFGRPFWPDPLVPRILTSTLVEVLYLLQAALVLFFLYRAVIPFGERVRQDWTQMSYLAFGMALPLILVDDPYRGLEGWRIASAMLLTLGGLLYLIAPDRWLRVGVLVLPVLISGILLSMGIYEIFPNQIFARGNPTFRTWEALQPLLRMVPAALLIVLPAILPFLSKPAPASGSPASH
jgi:hypothetical protein